MSVPKNILKVTFHGWLSMSHRYLGVHKRFAGRLWRTHYGCFLAGADCVLIHPWLDMLWMLSRNSAAGSPVSAVECGQKPSARRRRKSIGLYLRFCSLPIIIAIPSMEQVWRTSCVLAAATRRGRRLSRHTWGHPRLPNKCWENKDKWNFKYNFPLI